MATKKSTEVVPQEESTGMTVTDAQRALMNELKGEAIAALDIGSDLRLPNLVLVQPTSSLNDARPGDIYHSLTGECFKSVSIVPVKVFKTRARFGKKLGDPPLCSSPDAINGYGDPGDDLPQRGPAGGGFCMRCPEASIRTGTCKLQYNYVGILLGEAETESDEIRDIEFEMPVGFMMKSTSAKIGIRLNSIMMSQEYPWDHAIDLTSIGTENEQGRFQIWGVARGRKISERELNRVLDIAEQLRQASSIEIVEDDSMEAPTSSSSGSKEEDFGF